MQTLEMIEQLPCVTPPDVDALKGQGRETREYLLQRAGTDSWPAAQTIYIDIVHVRELQESG